MIYKQIGEKIKEYRNVKHLTQDQLGERVGVSYQQIQKYEKGNTKIYVSRLYDIAKALDVSVAALLSESEGFMTGEKRPNFSMAYITKEEHEIIQLYRKLKDEDATSTLADLLKKLCK